MRYEEFRGLWHELIRASGLHIVSFPQETLDVGTLERTYEVMVEPAGGQAAEGYNSAATLKWRWDALKSARTATTENDMMTELLGRQMLYEPATEQPWLRVDIELKALLHSGTSRPLLVASAFRHWSGEVHKRLMTTEPLLPDEWVREGPGGQEVLAWQGTPAVDIECTPEGDLLFGGVRLAAFQILSLPRQLDGDEDDADDDPDLQVSEMLARVHGALRMWMETLHLLDEADDDR